MLLPCIDFVNHPAYAAASDGISDEERARNVGEYGSLIAAARKKFAPYQEVWQSRTRNPIDEGASPLSTLARDGILGLMLPGPLKGQLHDVAAPQIQALREQEDKAQTRMEFNEIASSDVGAVLKRVIGHFGLMPMISAYLGMPKVAVPVVHFKLADTQFARTRGMVDVFPDGDFPDPSTRYFHVDAPPCDLKLIIYLSEVHELSDGPFSYVIGTHASPYLTLEEFAVRAATQEFARSRSAGNRRKLMCLPEIYRQRIDFGSDLLEDNPVARQLLAKERVFYSQDADMVLFDSKGIHRGAMVNRGSRAVMQVTFQGLL